jgi:hypothetical protein
MIKWVSCEFLFQKLIFVVVSHLNLKQEFFPKILKITSNFGGILEPKISYGRQSSNRRMKVDGPLRPSDAIVFRGSVENPFGVHAFHLLYGASRADSKG